MARYSSQCLVSALCLLAMGGCGHSPKSSVQQCEVVSINQDSEADYSKAALVNVELGLGYLSQGQVARAKQKLTHALQLAPNLMEPHSAMAYFLERVGEPQEAEKEYKKAIKLGQGRGVAYNNYGSFLCRQERLEEADQAFQRALQDKAYPHTAEVYENAGLCAIKGSNLLRAEHYFSKAIQQDPRRLTALLELANLKLNQHQWEQARTLLTQYQANAEPSARSLWLAIQAAEGLKDNTAAAKQVLLLENLFKDSPEYQLYLKTKLGKL